MDAVGDNTGKYESQIKYVAASSDSIYDMLSDLNNISRIKERIPADKIKDLRFDTDTCSITVEPVGEIIFSICERTPKKTIKFSAVNSPVPLNLWIQMLPTAEKEAKIKVTCKVELNIFLRNMVSRQLQEAVDRLADILAAIPYEK